MTDGKRFTIQEANEAIPQLERRLARLARRMNELREQAPDGEEEVRQLGWEGGRPVPWAYFQGVQEILEDSRSLQERGFIVRDLQRGLVDFPARLDGREVFLCWVRGERQVGWFHEADDGFAGRKPLPREATRSSDRKA